MKKILTIAFLFLASIAQAGELTLDEQTKAVCNKAMLAIYEDILAGKDKYQELEYCID